jgi:hypothetical protein
MPRRDVIEDLKPLDAPTRARVEPVAMDFSNTDVEDHLHYLFRGTHGYVFLARIDRSATRDGKPDHAPRGRSFKWPEERDDAVAWAMEQKNRPWTEVFYCVNPMRTRTMTVNGKDRSGRAVGNSAARYVVHADVDTVLPGAVQRRLKRLGFRLVSSGTPGRVHVLARLSRSLTLPEHRAVERALQKMCRADSKVADNDYLRLPDTWNYKNHPSLPAGKRNPRRMSSEILWHGKETVNADMLMAELGAAVTDDDRAVGVTAEAWKKVPVTPGRLPGYLQTYVYMDSEGDDTGRFKQCHAAVMAFAEYGWDRDQIHTVLDRFDPGVEKWGYEGWHRELDRILRKRGEGAGGDIEAYDVEEEFWSSRPILKHIRESAIASMASPWSTFGVVMTRVLHTIPPNVQLPKLTGGRRGGGSGSVNLFVALIGNSGGGKMTATGAGIDAVETGVITDGMSIGSGEGISKAFKGKGEGDALERTALWFDVSEVTTWNAIASRQGATLSAEVCRAWSGEALGFQNADREKTNHVRKDTYRMTMIIGAQPGQCGPLLGAIDMGLPQRFLFLPTWYDLPEDDPPMPDAWAWERPAFDKDGYTIRIPEEVTRMMRQTRREQIRETYKGDPLQSHALLLRLRVAFALALLDDRVDVSGDDWDLAGTVIHVHDKTRGMVMETLARKRRIENVKRGRDEGERRLAAERTVRTAVDAEVSKVAELLLTHLVQGPKTGNELRKKVAYRKRIHLDDALALLVEKGQVVRKTARGGGSEGVKYSVK